MLKMKSIGISLLIIQSLLCYWDMPHMIISQIAEDELKEKNPKAFERAIEVLKPLRRFFYENEDSIIESSLIPDHIKDEHFHFMANSHAVLDLIAYKNSTPISIPSYLSNDSRDTLKMIENVFKEPTSTKQVPPHLVKSLLLRYAIHIIGDLHQPLHVVSMWSDKYKGGIFKNGDIGGYKVSLENQGSGVSNLHTFWDSAGLGYSQRFPTPLNHQDKQYIKSIADKLKTKFNDEHNDNQSEDWSLQKLEEEISEIARIGENDVYSEIESFPRVPKNYITKSRKTCERLMVVGGKRLARMLIHFFKLEKSI